MFSKSSTLYERQQQIPILFKGDSYEFWSIKMKTLLKSEGLWDFGGTDLGAGPSEKSVIKKKYQKEDAKALYFIQQAVDGPIFPKIAAATSAKEAWSLLKTEYQGSNKEDTVVEFGEDDVRITVQSLAKSMGTEFFLGLSAPSIYMVPSTLKYHNPSSFKPRMVSIGPLHREDENLQANEAEKGSYMLRLLTRSGYSPPVEGLTACVLKVLPSIRKIRSWYPDTKNYDDNELVEIMVMDGCFILEYLLGHIEHQGCESLAKMTFVHFAMYDLVLLENQIPFFVLEDIFECTIFKFDQTASLIELIHTLLEHVNPFKKHRLKITLIRPYATHHILSLLHECYQSEDAKPLGFSTSRFPSAVELDRAGVNFKDVRDSTKWALLMEVKWPSFPCFSFSWGKPTLIMPELDINDFTELVLRNLIAYEQLSIAINQYITSYVMAMDMLIDTEEDIAKLVKSKVIVNRIGSNQNAADMINNLCKELDYRVFFYSKQWEDLSRYYNSNWSKHIAWLRRTYFNNPWNSIALIAGIVLFILTVIQTYYTVKAAMSVK